MPATTPTVIATAAPGTLAPLRGFFLKALVASVAYGFLTHGSKGGWTGTQEQVSFEIGPSPLMFLAIAVIAIGSFRAVDRAGADAARVLRRRLWLIIALVIVSLVATWLWIGLYPLDGWPNAGTWIYPFPFASVEMTHIP